MEKFTSIDTALIPAEAGIQFFGEALGPRLRGDERAAHS